MRTLREAERLQQVCLVPSQLAGQTKSAASWLRINPWAAASHKAAKRGFSPGFAGQRLEAEWDVNRIREYASGHLPSRTRRCAEGGIAIDSRASVPSPSD